MDKRSEILPSFCVQYDFSRYVLVTNLYCDDPSDVLDNVYEEAPYRILSLAKENLGWSRITIKYPNKRIAIREANYLHRKSKQTEGFIVNMASHTLAHFAKLELENRHFLDNPTYVVISNFPQRITVKRWRMILPKFGRVVIVRQERARNGELSIVVKYETMAEALGVVIALHEHDVDGQTLLVKTYQGTKEKFLLSCYESAYEQCVCLVKNCFNHPPPDLTSEYTKELFSPLRRICSFCQFPQSHPEVEECNSAEYKAQFNDEDVPWENEFPLLNQSMVIKDDWVFVDEDDYSAPRLDDRNWEVVNFRDMNN